MLDFEEVVFQFPTEDRPIIDHLSFHVERGEFVSIIGASGCGKSTIFRLINRLLVPESGVIRIGGQEQTPARDSGRAAFSEGGRNRTDKTEKMEKSGKTGNAKKTKKTRQSENSANSSAQPQPGAASGKRTPPCGYMPQQDLLFPWRTVEQNLCLPMELQGGIPREEQRRRAQQALEEVGLAGKGDKRPSELSGGMRQRAAFARTLLTGAELLLLDEPFSALDYLTRIEMREWLLQQWERDRKTVLFITHDVEEAIFLSGRVLVTEHSPITELTSVEVPLGYPRSIESLKDPDVQDLKESMIEKLRRHEA